VVFFDILSVSKPLASGTLAKIATIFCWARERTILMDADTIVLDFPSFYQVIQITEDFRHIKNFRRGPVQLHQVQCLNLKVLQAAFNESVQILPGKTFCQKWV